MNKFSQLEQLSDDELIIIVFEQNSDWQADAIEYASQILDERGIDPDVSEIRYFELIRENKTLCEKELSNRLIDSYTTLELLMIGVFWYRYLFYDWGLKEEGYFKRYRQRLNAIGIGFTVYSAMTIIAFFFTNPDRVRPQEIRQLEITDSLRMEQTDWSGKYIFIDSNLSKSEKTIWQLTLQKSNNEHLGTLQLINEDTFTINCIGAIKNDEIGILPDTTYTLPDGREIGRYDKLFTLQKENDSLISYWNYLQPFHYNGSNNRNLFVQKQ